FSIPKRIEIVQCRGGQRDAYRSGRDGQCIPGERITRVSGSGSIRGPGTGRLGIAGTDDTIGASIDRSDDGAGKDCACRPDRTAAAATAGPRTVIHPIAGIRAVCSAGVCIDRSGNGGRIQDDRSSRTSAAPSITFGLVGIGTDWIRGPRSRGQQLSTAANDRRRRQKDDPAAVPAGFAIAVIFFAAASASSEKDPVGRCGITMRSETGAAHARICGMTVEGRFTGPLTARATGTIIGAASASRIRIISASSAAGQLAAAKFFTRDVAGDPFALPAACLVATCHIRKIVSRYRDGPAAVIGRNGPIDQRAAFEALTGDIDVRIEGDGGGSLEHNDASLAAQGIPGLAGDGSADG